MIKDSKYIIKRVIIGVCIALIIMLIKGNLITSVYAKENKNNIYYYLPDDEEMQNFNNVIWTNFATDTLDPTLPFTMGARYDYSYRYKNEPNRLYGYGSIGGYSDFIGQSYNLISTSDIAFPNDYYSSVDMLTYYVSSMGNSQNNTFSTHLPIVKSSTYEVLIELEKTDNLTWYANADNMFQDSSLYNLSIVNSSATELPQSAIDYKNVEWIPPSGVPGGGDSNLAYIKIRFSLKDIVNTDIYYLFHIALTSSLPMGGMDNCNTGSGRSCGTISFVFNGTDSTGIIRTKSFSIIEDGYISLSSSETDIPGIMPGLDSITQNDLMIKNKYQECATTDIACHFENLQTGLFDILVRIGNFFTNLIANIKNLFDTLFEYIIHIFVPNDSDFDMLHDEVLRLRGVLHQKLGFLIYPFELIATLFNSYINLLSNKTYNHIITLPVLKEPFSNNTIWNGGTLDLGEVFSTGAIGDFHSLYMAFVSCYIVIMFVDFCYKSFCNFVEGKVFINKKGSGTE